MNLDREKLISGEIDPDAYIRQLDEQERALFLQSALGLQCQEFLEGEAGKLLRGYALQERSSCLADMARINPWSPFARRKLAKLQFRVAVTEQFVAFFAEAIQAGEQAHHNLKSMNR